MGCKLTAPPGSPKPTPGPPPSGPNVFNAAKDAEITVFADSDSGTVHLIAADLNGVKVSLDVNFRATFKVSPGGNILSMTFVGSDPDEIFRIEEDCGGGNSPILRTWRLKPVVPGGPTTQITIHAT